MAQPQATAQDQGKGGQLGRGVLDWLWQTEKLSVLNFVTLGYYSTYLSYQTVGAKYQEEGVVGAANSVNPFFQVPKGGIDVYRAIERGDYRAAGESGAGTAATLAAIVLGSGEGVDGALETPAPVPKLPEGSFSIVDWTGYPAGLPQPSGPFRLLDSAEYQVARAEVNAANKALHTADPAKYAGKDIHEIHPVKFGGSPTNPANKVALPRGQHSPFTTWWNTLQRQIEQ
jgi:hypothetical protein